MQDNNTALTNFWLTRCVSTPYNNQTPNQLQAIDMPVEYRITEPVAGEDFTPDSYRSGPHAVVNPWRKPRR